LDEVLDGFITSDHARNDYGVVLDEVDDGYGFALNTRETEGLRATLKRSARPSGNGVAG
jgi:N-methylhydantoinase B